jgi:hypothetical protein
MTVAVSRWRDVHKQDLALVALADRHYTRQTPGSRQCCRPGFNLCLVTSDGRAGWVVWRPRPDVGRKDHLEAWECTLFRNESPGLSSELIREATDIVWRRWGWPPRDGLITAVDAEETEQHRSPHYEPGRCFRAAGWKEFERRVSRSGGTQVWLRAPHPKRTERS